MYPTMYLFFFFQSHNASIFLFSIPQCIYFSFFNPTMHQICDILLFVINPIDKVINIIDSVISIIRIKNAQF